MHSCTVFQERYWFNCTPQCTVTSTYETFKWSQVEELQTIRRHQTKSQCFRGLLEGISTRPNANLNWTTRCMFRVVRPTSLPERERETSASERTRREIRVRQEKQEPTTWHLTTSLHILFSSSFRRLLWIQHQIHKYRTGCAMYAITGRLTCKLRVLFKLITVSVPCLIFALCENRV